LGEAPRPLRAERGTIELGDEPVAAQHFVERCVAS